MFFSVFFKVNRSANESPSAHAGMFIAPQGNETPMTPHPPWNPANNHTVHHSWIGGQPVGKRPAHVTGERSPMALFGGIALTRTTLVVLACATAAACVMMVRRSVALPWFVPVGFYIIIGGVLAWWLVGAARSAWFSSENAVEGADRVVSDAYRVRCIGGQSRRQRLGRVEDVPFEPEIFDGSIAEGGAPGGRVARAACSFAGAGVVAVGMWLATGKWPGVGGNTGLVYPTLLFGAVLGGVVASILWPVYYRVVPGRIDRISTGFLARGPTKRESWSLRDCGVTVDLYRRLVLIDPPGSPRLVLHASLLGPAHEFERAVLMGAISSAIAPVDDGDVLEA